MTIIPKCISLQTPTEHTSSVEVKRLQFSISQAHQKFPEVSITAQRNGLVIAEKSLATFLG
jgi:hypothetical protein